MFDRAQMKVIVAVVRTINQSLLCTDVIRPDRKAKVLGTLGYQAATGEEIDKGWKMGDQEFV